MHSGSNTGASTPEGWSTLSGLSHASRGRALVPAYNPLAVQTLRATLQEATAVYGSTNNRVRSPATMVHAVPRVHFVKLQDQL